MIMDVSIQSIHELRNSVSVTHCWAKRKACQFCEFYHVLVYCSIPLSKSLKMTNHVSLLIIIYIMCFEEYLKFFPRYAFYILHNLNCLPPMIAFPVKREIANTTQNSLGVSRV
ncbi:hypothetical protein PanWU01x14_350130 [Parasponia andersonii]|uniref:Uncharacterized protein n=1 Tax=Parasponia andersonii TaxID=3476 RepID=A0A2P5AB39_PARAD|nr:hypothetical protein PanWU01x14_350130 [Parasponia andersonii]